MKAGVDLHGRLPCEPFTREERRLKQPVSYRYLNRCSVRRGRETAYAVARPMKAVSPAQQARTAEP